MNYRYNTIKYNDIANGPGIAVSVYLQGCPHHCKNCFNPETWNFDGGREFTDETLSSIIKGLTANNIKRHLAILGGEPLCMGDNILLTYDIVYEVKKQLPNIKIYIWTGYTYEELIEVSRISQVLRCILKKADFLIDGPYIEELRDVTLKMRGSMNQRIINLKTGEIEQ